MFREFKIEEISKEKFIAIKLPNESFYFGELIAFSPEGHLLDLIPETEDLTTILNDSTIRKLRNGYGIQIDYETTSQNNSNIKSVYEGQFIENDMIGLCKITYSDGQVYNGSVRSGLKDGYGRLQWKDGRIYQGFWKGDRMEGSGVFIGFNQQYEGSFINNLYMTKEGCLISPFLEIDRNEDFGKLDRKAKSVRDKNLHRKYCYMRSVRNVQDIKEMAINSFTKDRFVLLISRLNSGWSFTSFIKTLENEFVLVLDCLHASYLYENDKEAFKKFMEDFTQRLSLTLEKGGLLVLNFNYTNDPMFRSEFDPDMYFILNFTKALGKLLTPKQFKDESNVSNFLLSGKIHESFGIILYSDFRIEKNLDEKFARQKVSTRFHFFCNPDLADIAVLENSL